MLDLAQAWWQTTGALLNAPIEIKQLETRIASETALAQGQSKYAHLHLMNVETAQRDLEALQKLVPQLEKQKRDLEQRYHDSGYDDVPYASWTTGEMRVGGKRIEEVGRAVGMGGKPAGLQPTGIEFDIASAFLAGPAILRLGKAVLGKALGKVRVPTLQPASFGQATSSNYRKTFFDAHPAQEGKVIVHHAVEQQVLKKYPGVMTESELHSLENLRGIPKGANAETHLSEIRREWNAFYEHHPTATKEELIQKATEIDNKYGHRFVPPIR